MLTNKLTCVLLIFTTNVLLCSSLRITFPGCDRAGWKCIKIQPSPIRYLLEYTCQNVIGIEITLWNFNAPGEIKELHIQNCSSLEIDLTCTAVSRLVEKLTVKNVGILNFTNLVYNGAARVPEKVIFEDIGKMPFIPPKTFKQMKHPTYAAHKCAATVKPIEKITFKNVTIGTIAQNAFYNLTQMLKFDWKKVTVDKMEPLAIQVEMEPNNEFSVIDSSFQRLDFKAFSIRSSSIKFEQSKFGELRHNAINATSFKFDFINNSVEKINPFGFILLSQDITFQNNNFTLLETSALQGIGPGLLANAFMSFGYLQFTYNFNNNTILHSNIGGLNPDWIAYKNVRGVLTVKSNYLPCSCNELGWITLRSGLGKEFTTMMTFNSKYLDIHNNNLCFDSPCALPITVMAAMHITFGQCKHQPSLVSWCKQYNPKNTKDYGFGPSAKIILNKWQNDFTPDKPNDEEEQTEDLEALESMYALAKKAEDLYTDPSVHKESYTKGNNPRESYFKIERTSLLDSDPLTSLLQQVTNSKDYNEVAKPTDNTDFTTVDPIIYFDDNETTSENGTEFKYRMDVRNGGGAAQNSTDKPSVGFNTLKKEYEEEQKDFIKNSYEQWKAERKKRMVYFKVYGNLVTLN